MAEEKEKLTETAEEAAETQASPETEAAPTEEAAQSDAPADEAVPEPTPEEKLSEEVESLKKQLADEKEKYLRLDAEYYNYRTRSSRKSRTHMITPL